MSSNYITQKSKYGILYRKSNDDQAKINCLSIINRLGNKFSKEDFLDLSLIYGRDNHNKVKRELQRLLRARKQGWIKKNKEGTFEKSENFEKRYFNYRRLKLHESEKYKEEQRTIIKEVEKSLRFEITKEPIGRI